MKPDSGHPSGAIFDDAGIPRILVVSDWLDVPVPLDTRGFQAILRFSRANGSTVFGPTGRDERRLRRLDQVAARLGDHGLAAVVARWVPGGLASRLPLSPLPVPTDSRPDRVLAVLRSDWAPRGEWVAVDHRRKGSSSSFEVAAKGQVWLGAEWNSSFDKEARFTKPRPVRWISSAYADLLEWSFSVGRSRVTRSITQLRGRSMAILGQQVEGATSSSDVRLTLGESVQASFVCGSTGLILSAGAGKPTCRLIPLGLPVRPGHSDRGSIAIEGREIVIRQPAEGKTSWIPILVAWGQPPSLWNRLTVAHRSNAVKPGQAFAARVSFRPRDPGLVVYRSLGPTALRSFIGYQTSAKFLVGTFTSTGEVVPIVKVDG